MYVRNKQPEEVFPQRLAGLMQDFTKENGSTGLSQSELARLICEKRYGTEGQSRPDGRYAAERDREYKALARRISHFIKGDHFPRWADLVEIADFFGKPIGYLIGETDCDSYELQDVADFIGLESESVAALKRMTTTVGVEWLLEKTTPENEKPSKASVFIAQDMVEKANAEPEACKAVLNRMFTAKAFKDLLISLANVGEGEHELLMARIDAELTKLRQEDDSADNENEIMQQMARKSQARDTDARRRSAEGALKASRFEAHEYYVRLVDEMFSDMANTDISAQAKRIAKQKA